MFVIIYSCLLVGAVSLKINQYVVAPEDSIPNNVSSNASTDDIDILNYIEIGSVDGLFFANMATLRADSGWQTMLLRNRTQKNVLNISTCQDDSRQVEWNPVTKEYTLPCQSFEQMMELANFDHVDILSLDVNGAEFYFLNALDVDVLPKILVVELSGEHNFTDDSVRRLLQDKGYARSSWDIANACNDSKPTFHPQQRQYLPCEYPAHPMLADCMLGNEVFALNGTGPALSLPMEEPQKPMTMCRYKDLWGEKGRKLAIRERKIIDAQVEMRRITTEQTSSCSTPLTNLSGFFSQGHEDEGLLLQFYCGTFGGTYVEIGALDGRHFSNTKFFEDTMNWTGVLIEANPTNAASIPKNRRGPPYNTIYPMAVCPEEAGNLTFISGKVGDGTGGVLDTMADSHFERWHEGQDNYTVPCKPIGKMLGEANLKHVDIFSLDVEGAELAVLETMDWNIAVCLFIVELDGQNETKDEAVRQLLLSKGYTRDKQAENAIILRCQALQPASPIDCSLGNEIFVHDMFETCGVKADSHVLIVPPFA